MTESGNLVNDLKWVRMDGTRLGLLYRPGRVCESSCSLLCIGQVDMAATWTKIKKSWEGRRVEIEPGPARVGRPGSSAPSSFLLQTKH